MLISDNDADFYIHEIKESGIDPKLHIRDVCDHEIALFMNFIEQLERIIGVYPIAIFNYLTTVLGTDIKNIYYMTDNKMVLHLDKLYLSLKPRQNNTGFINEILNKIQAKMLGAKK